MKDTIKEMKRAIRNYILDTNYDEMDEDARIEKFWKDLGENYFTDEAIEDYLAKRTEEALELMHGRDERKAWNEERKRALVKSMKVRRDKMRLEKIEIGEEAFNEKHPPLTLEEKRDKVRKTIKKFKLEKLSRKE